MYLCAYTVLRVFARCHVAWIVSMCTHTHTHSYLQLHRTYWITIDRMYSYVNIYKYMHIQSRSIIHNNIQSHPYHISWPILFHYIYIYITWTPQPPSYAVTLPPRTWLERCYRRNRCHPAENPPVKRPKREWLTTPGLSWSVDLSRKLCVFQPSQTSLGVLKHCWKYLKVRSQASMVACVDEDKVFLASVLPMGPVFGIKHSMGSPASVGICSKMDKTLGFSSFRLDYWMVDMCCPTNHCCCHKLARSRQKPTKKKLFRSRHNMSHWWNPRFPER